MKSATVYEVFPCRGVPRPRGSTAAEPRLGRQLFALAGVDVMADEEGRFWLLEFNRNPSGAPTSLPRCPW